MTSLHHNVSAALPETFGVAWRPTSEPVWLLGQRYEARGVFSGGGSQGATGVTGQFASAPSLNSSVRGGAGGCAVAGEAPILCFQAVGDNDGEKGCEFAAAWAQISRMTYRKGFAPMYRCVRAPPGSAARSSSCGAKSPRRGGQYVRLTSDAGWGCMIRVGQMLLATALKRHSQGSTVSPKSDASGKLRSGSKDGDGHAREAIDASAGGVEEPDEIVSRLERQFLDDPDPEGSPFSIFGFIRAAHGREQLTQKRPGDWFGPTTISETIGMLVERNQELKESLSVYVNSDGVLYEDEVLALASGKVPRTASAAKKRDRCELAGVEVPFTAAQNIEAYDVDTASEAVPRPNPSQANATASNSVGSSAVGVAAPSSAGRGAGESGASDGAGDSDDEFTVVRTANVASAGAWSPLLKGQAEPTVEPDLDMLDLETLDLGPSCCDADFETNQFQVSDSVGTSVRDSFQDLAHSFNEVPPNACHGSQDYGRAGGESGDVDDGTTDSTDRSSEHFGIGVEASAADVAPSAAQWKRAVLLLFPMQLGIEKYVREAHVPAVLRYFELPASLGAMGGRPRMAHYFVGRQERGLLYVDPHVVQPAAVSQPSHQSAAWELTSPRSGRAFGAGESGGSSSSTSTAGLEAFRNLPVVQAIPVEHIDASISFAFYCRSASDLEGLLRDLRRVDSEAADAPIRVEAVRPPALRDTWRPTPPIAAKGAAWADADCDDLAYPPSYPIAATKPEAVVDIGSNKEAPDGCDRGASYAEDILLMSDLQCSQEISDDMVFLGPSGSWCRAATSPATTTSPASPPPLAGDLGRSVRVGASWADGAWADVGSAPDDGAWAEVAMVAPSR